MSTVKDTHFHARLNMSAGTQRQWKELLKEAENRGVKAVLSDLQGDFQDVHALIRRKENEKPFVSKKAAKGKYKNYLILGCIQNM